MADRRRRFLAIVNAEGGTVARLGAEAVRAELVRYFREYGIDAEIAMAEGDRIGELTDHARAAAAAGTIDAIAVGGGDGTIRSVAERLAESGVVLGLLPLGTLNHFARDLGIPLALGEAIAVLAGFHVAAVDAGEVNGKTFINNSSVGIYPYLVMDRDERRRTQGIGKWWATLPALFRALRRFPRRRLIVEAEDRRLARRTPCLFVANNEYDVTFSSLGRKQLDAGRLFLYVARAATPLALLWLAIRLGLNLKRNAHELDLIEVREAEIRSRASRLPVALDGEVEMMATPLRYRSRPGALRVIVPERT